MDSSVSPDGHITGLRREGACRRRDTASRLGGPPLQVLLAIITGQTMLASLKISASGILLECLFWFFARAGLSFSLLRREKFQSFEESCIAFVGSGACWRQKADNSLSGKNALCRWIPRCKDSE